MSGSTPEINLRTAVDSDDNADYLTLDLANSLRTVDALFNNVTGHNHGGAHQGGPLMIGANQIADGSITSPKIADGAIGTVDLADASVTSAKLAPPIDIAGYFRTTNVTSYPTSGVGLEMYYSPGTGGILQTFDRTGTVYGPTLVIGSTVSLHVGGTAGLTVNADGSVTTAGAITVGGGTLNLGSGIVILNDGNSLFYRATAPGQHYFQHTDGSAAAINAAAVNASGLVSASAGLNVTGTINTTTLSATTLNATTINIANGGSIDGAGSGYVRASSLTVTPGPFAAANTNINGTLTVQAAANFGSTVTATTFTATSTGYFFINNTVSIQWDNTYLRHSHSIAFNTTGNQVVWPNGSYISGNAGYVQGSQRALKEDVTPVPDSELITRVVDPRMVVSTYNWPEDTRQSIGFMAEDVAAVLPNYVIRDEDGTPTGYNPQELTAILWGALRQLDARVQTLEAA
jgi:hypothetical protein